MRHRSLVLCLLLAVAWPSAAHRMPGSLTTVEYNPATDRVEIVHRLHAHDAELGVGTLLDEPDFSFDDLEDRATLALYVEKRFALAAWAGGEGGEQITLSLVGAELEGDWIFVYQEYAEALPAEFAVRDDILRDVFPAQANQVNVSLAGSVRTLMFRGEDRWQRYPP